MSEDEETERLLQKATQTMELGFAVEIIEKEEAAGRWPDVTRLEDRRPDILGAIVWMLARDVPVRSICDALKPLSPCTVNAVRHHPRWKEAVVSKRQTIVEKIDTILAMKLDQVLDDAKRGELPSVFDSKLLFDMRQLMTGGATARVEVVESNEEKQAREFFERARQVTQLPPLTMDSEVEIISPKTPTALPSPETRSNNQSGDN